MRGGGEVAIKVGDGIGAIGNGLSIPSHVAVVRAPGSGAGGVAGAADTEVLPCVPCAGSGVLLVKFLMASLTTYPSNEFPLAILFV